MYRFYGGVCMALVSKIQRLQRIARTKPGGILSIYLDTDRSTPEQQKGQWKVRLKNGLKKLEEYLSAQGASLEKSNFKALAKKVKKEIEACQREHQKGLILFASDDLELFEMEIVQVKVENEFHWEKQPITSQLEEINQKYPCSGMILAHADHIRVVETCLGQVEDEFGYQWEIDTEDWRYYKGPASGSGQGREASSSLTDQYTKRKEVQMIREYKRLIPKLQEEALERQWKGIYLVGDPMLIQILKEGLHQLRIIDCIPKNMKASSSHDLIDKVI